MQFSNLLHLLLLPTLPYTVAYKFKRRIIFGSSHYQTHSTHLCRL